MWVPTSRTGRLTTVCQRSDYRFLVAEQSERREKDEDSTGIHEAFKDWSKDLSVLVHPPGSSGFYSIFTWNYQG